MRKIPLSLATLHMGSMTEVRLCYHQERACYLQLFIPAAVYPCVFMLLEEAPEDSLGQSSRHLNAIACALLLKCTIDPP